jgi:hypothetical protein
MSRTRAASNDTPPETYRGTVIPLFTSPFLWIINIGQIKAWNPSFLG